MVALASMVRNAEPFLGTMLSSLREQLDFRNSVVVDHESDDRTLLLLREYGIRTLRVPTEAYYLFGDTLHSLPIDHAVDAWILHVFGDEFLHHPPRPLHVIVADLDRAGHPAGKVAIVSHGERSEPKCRLIRQDQVRMIGVMHIEDCVVLDWGARRLDTVYRHCGETGLEFGHLGAMKTIATRNERHMAFGVLMRKHNEHPSPYAGIQAGDQFPGTLFEGCHATFKRWCHLHNLDYDLLTTEWGPEHLERALVARGRAPSSFDLHLLWALHDKYVGRWTKT